MECRLRANVALNLHCDRHRPKKYPDELIARGIGLALESGRPIAHVAADLGIHPETLRKRVRQGEVFELRRANEILKSASVFFAKELDEDRTR
jgi:transposase